MANGTVVVKGLRETVRTLKKFGTDVADLKAAFKRIGNIVANEAQSLAPRRTGKLAGSIKASNTQNKSTVKAGTAKIPYAGVIHFGGYNNITPVPFLYQALDNKSSETNQAFETEISGLIRSMGLSN